MTVRHGTKETMDATWARFRAERGAQLSAWIEAERALHEARRTGAENFDAGDRLLAAEAALQTSIVDFAAGIPNLENPDRVALEVLRRAEALLQADHAVAPGTLRAPANSAGALPPSPVPARRLKAR